MPKFNDPNLLVGFDTSDDAAVYKIDSSTAIVQSVDIFPPIVDDPYDYGAIAAANSLSDIYAMGGDPKLAMNILCIPEDLNTNIVKEILHGGYDKVKEAGAVICGGHTINDKEPKYGLSVTGLISVQNVLLNSKLKPNEVLILTKPIGTGILSTAAKADLLDEHAISSMIDSMKMLNNVSAEIISRFSVSACTDITGFGLLGHAFEMAHSSNVSITINANSIPILPSARQMAKMGVIPKGCYANQEWLRCNVSVSDIVPLDIIDICYDPQTSGGLLFSINEKDADRCISQLKNVLPYAETIGYSEKFNGKYLSIV